MCELLPSMFIESRFRVYNTIISCLNMFVRTEINSSMQSSLKYIIPLLLLFKIFKTTKAERYVKINQKNNAKSK